MPFLSPAQKEAELKAEWDYCYNERLGMITQGAVPTEREMQIAKIEADKFIERLRKATP